MATRIRLQRFGKKNKPFYHVVIADSRSKRDGKFIEKIGTYNPNTNPAAIDIKLDRAVHWLGVGAQPSETVDRLLSYIGAKLKHHLNGGVAKGAHTQEEADKKFDAWMAEKEAKIQAKIDGLSEADKQKAIARLEHEAKVNQERANSLKAAAEEAAKADADQTNTEEEAPAEETSEDTAE